MEMTNSEIVISYKQAKHKAQQIGILAELNRCSNKQIIEILLNGGIPLKSFNRFKDIVPAERSCIDTTEEPEIEEEIEEQEEEWDAAPEEVEEPAEPEEQIASESSTKGIYELFAPIHEKVKDLRQKREKIDNELAELNMYLNRIEDEIAGRNDNDAAV